MSAKHTPGPWYVGEANRFSNKTSHIGIHAEEWIVAEVQTDIAELPGEANANLIAAAPDLLEELKEVLTWATVEGIALRQQEIDSIRAVIAKATGEDQ